MFKTAYVLAALTRSSSPLPLVWEWMRARETAPAAQKIDPQILKPGGGALFMSLGIGFTQERTHRLADSFPFTGWE